jgi:predicted nucleic acid-binding protein
VIGVGGFDFLSRASLPTRAKLCGRDGATAEHRHLVNRSVARDDVLLIDDKKGRRLAEAYDVHCLGLPAVVLAAHRRGLVPSVAAFLDLMERQGNYGLSARARAQVLRAAGQ